MFGSVKNSKPKHSRSTPNDVYFGGLIASENRGP